MEKVHFNCKPMRFELDGKIKDFPSRVKLLEYMEEVHGISPSTVRKIINNKKPYKPRVNALKYLTGLKIYHI